MTPAKMLDAGGIVALNQAAARLIPGVARAAAPIFRAMKWTWWIRDRKRIPTRADIQSALGRLVALLLPPHERSLRLPALIDGGRFRLRVEASLGGFRVEFSLPFESAFLAECETR